MILVSGASASAAPPTADAASNSKANAPETNLSEYPKRHDVPGYKPATPPASAAARSAEVVVTSTRDVGGGITEQTICDPGPGVKPATLAAELQAQGVHNGAVVADQPPAASTSNAGPLSRATTAAAAAVSCSYGTARTFCSPQQFSSNDGHSDPQVYFNDHSGNLWPTDAAVYTWNQSVGIDSYYRYNSCGPAGTHCVEVPSGTYITSWSGQTSIKYETATGKYVGTGYTLLNERWARSADGYRKSVCHELAFTAQAAAIAT